MSKNCTITLWNEEEIELDEGMLDAVFNKVVIRHAPQASSIDIYTAARVPEDAREYLRPGWIEWLVKLQYYGGGSMVIGVLQRKPGEPYESHS